MDLMAFDPETLTLFVAVSASLHRRAAHIESLVTSANYLDSTSTASCCVCHRENRWSSTPKKRRILPIGLRKRINIVQWHWNKVFSNRNGKLSTVGSVVTSCPVQLHCELVRRRGHAQLRQKHIS